MTHKQQTLTILTSVLIGSSAFAGGDGWVNFEDQTSTRMPAKFVDPATSTNDTEEKDYAWGDLDNDGDVDLICIRKQPFTSTGRRTNVLFMNEGIAEGHGTNGVLVDKTAEYATASDVGGDQGFFTATNDRDVVIADFNGDGWLDVATATTLSDGQAKAISHPRVYMNLGEVDGMWQGLRYEEARIPELHDPTATVRFCSVAAGDIDGDNDIDLYFGDYDNATGAPPMIFDFNNRLFLNDGAGNFSDVSSARMDNQMLQSAFGAASIIADINNDGSNDVVKQTSLQDPTHIAVIYNDLNDTGIAEGYFTNYDVIDNNAPYFVNTADLNGDGLLDLIVVDDGIDSYYLNQGNGGDGMADFQRRTFTNSGGFGGNALARDLNNDGNPDVIITDVDVDIPGCSRRTIIYRNLGNLPSVSFQEQGQVIPNSELTGVHDAAIFDLNGDGWLDIVMGRCSGTQVWMNIPPVGLVFAYPSGLPGFVEPGQTTTVQVQLGAIGGGAPMSGSGKAFISVNGGPFIEQDMTDLGGDLYEATLPAADCTQTISFYFEAQLDSGGIFNDPAGAPGSTYFTVAASGIEVTVNDTIEGDVSSWTVESDPSLTTGAWEQAEPNGTIFNGELMAPDRDATQGAENVLCFVTENGPVGQETNPGLADVDNGRTFLMSPTIDLDGTDATISFSRWYVTDDGDDQFLVYVSNDNGDNWTAIPALTTLGTGSAWENVSFKVGDYVAPTAQVMVRFEAHDLFDGSLTEAGVDNFIVEEFICETCAADIAGDDDQVNTSDLLALLANWGTDGPGSDIAAPLDNVDISDLLGMLAAWGPCD